MANMILKTVVAVARNGGNVTGWIRYLVNKSITNDGYCSSLYYYWNNKWEIVAPIENPTGSQVITIQGLANIAENSGVIRQIIIAPLRMINERKMMILARWTILRFLYLTGKRKLITTYSYHSDTPYPHVHILMVSPIRSRLYIKPNQLELLKLIAAQQFKETIGKIAYLRYIEDLYRHAPEEKRGKLEAKNE